MVVATNRRYVHRHLNYNGDLTQDLEVGSVMGPNLLGEMFTVLSVVYNPKTDKTRVGFDFTRTDDYQPGALEGVEVLEVP